jgi:hypothetical protein
MNLHHNNMFCEGFQEATSKYEVDLETDGVMVEPATGALGPGGNATLHFTRDANQSSTVTTRVSCKVFRLTLFLGNQWLSSCVMYIGDSSHDAQYTTEFSVLSLSAIRQMPLEVI